MKYFFELQVIYVNLAIADLQSVERWF